MMHQALPPVDPTTVPADLLAFVDSFALPCGLTIRRSVASMNDGPTLVGWRVEGGPLEFLYSDGVFDSRPGYRALEAMGLSDEGALGEDDEQWRRYGLLMDEFSRMVTLTLEQAWATVRASGFATRYAREGERVTVQRAGRRGVVLNPGTDRDGGHHVRVQLDDGTTGTYRLRDLLLDEG